MKTTHPGGWADPALNCARTPGRASIEDAKMTGMTPAMLTLSGMYVLVPPYILRPIIRLAYCTGTRRCDCSTMTTSAMTRKPMRMTMIKTSQRPLELWIAARDCGKREAIEVKISSDMPLPMPRSVISSPIHMMTPVPAVMVRTMTVSYTHLRAHETVLDLVCRLLLEKQK